MPKVEGGVAAAHRELTLGRIYDSLRTLLYERGYDALTLADVAEASGLARTAMYNYFADKEALLVGYATHETDAFVARLDAELRPLDNPVDQLRTYLRLQLEYFSASNHLPPGPTRGSCCPGGRRRGARPRGRAEERLHHIVRVGRDRRYLRAEDLDATVAMISAVVSRASAEGLDDATRQGAVEATESSCSRAVGARFGADGRPRRLPRR